MHFVFTGRIRDYRGEATTYLYSICFLSQEPVATVKVRIVVKTIAATIMVTQNRFKGWFWEGGSCNLRGGKRWREGGEVARNQIAAFEVFDMSSKSFINPFEIIFTIKFRNIQSYYLENPNIQLEWFSKLKQTTWLCAQIFILFNTFEN